MDRTTGLIKTRQLEEKNVSIELYVLLRSSIHLALLWFFIMLYTFLSIVVTVLEAVSRTIYSGRVMYYIVAMRRASGCERYYRAVSRTSDYEPY